jgi:PPOX class probable FMN-dependent enzyme
MQSINDVAELEALYGQAFQGALDKVQPEITVAYRRWIEASRFLILSTVGPEGTDASPRGDAGPVVRLIDSKTLWLPDWRGNNRADSLKNIVRDGRLSLLFMVPGSNNVVRVNGRAIVTADATATESFEQNGRHPRSVIIVTVEEVYFQCAKALMRSNLWRSPDESDRVPTAGQFLKEMAGDFDARSYDAGYADYARDKMW